MDRSLAAALAFLLLSAPLSANEIAASLVKGSQLQYHSADADADAGTPGVIEGRVVDSADRPIQGAKVYVEEFRPARIYQMPPLRYVITDENGQFRIEHLRQGDYDIFVVPANSSSMLPQLKQRVHLSPNKPVKTVSIRMDSVRNVI